MRRVWTFLAAAVLLAAPVLAGEAERAAAFAAFDRGDAAAARPLLRREAAEAAFWLALAEAGEARKSAVETAARLGAGAGGWVEPATQGLAAAEADRGAEAVAAYRQAVAAPGVDGRIWKELGDQLLAGGDRAGAQSAYEKSVALLPDYPAALVELGDLQREAGGFGPAFNSYNHAVGADGKPVAALLGRAAARRMMGDRDGAVADLEKAISIAAPGGELYRALMASVGLSAYDRALPQGIDRAERAVAMWQELGRPDMAAAAANATGRLLLETAGDPAGAEAWYTRAGQIIAGSNLPQAERAIWRVRELHGLARAAAARREIDRAYQLAAEAQGLMERDTANAEHYKWIAPYLRGYLLLAERRYDEAIAELQSSDTERAHIRLLIADAYARKRDRQNARLWYERALAASTGLDVESAIAGPAAKAWLEKNR